VYSVFSVVKKWGGRGFPAYFNKDSCMKKFLIFLFPLFLFASPETTLAGMTLDQKIGQLFMAPACPARNQDHWAAWLKILKDCHVGNAIVKQSDPITQVKFLNRLQDESAIPLLISADAEWGLAMRMTNTIAFPRNMTLGAIDNIDLIYQLGVEIGRQAKLVGIHMNLAPVADVNNNPLNPVIHMRSFGEDPERVAACVSAYARGLKAGGTLACAKHFPGHGDTEVDSHRDLPVINHLLNRLEGVEFVPFKQVIDEGIDAIMTAHLYIPSIDPIFPTSLSVPCLKIARDTLRFQGLIVSDALNMKAIAGRYSPEEIALLARKAGCDLLLYGDHIGPNVDEILHESIPRAFKALKEAYLANELDLSELDQSVLRILRAKENIEKAIPIGNLMQALHSEKAISLKKQLFQEAVTLIGEACFPVPEKTAYVSFGENDVIGCEFKAVPLESAEKVVVAIHQKEALTSDVQALIKSLGPKAIVCFFATPYALKPANTILVGYENDQDAQQAVLNVLLGRVEAKGHLPVTVNGL
jgi:beta-N-acetylhexosaminidase